MVCRARVLRQRSFQFPRFFFHLCKISTKSGAHFLFRQEARQAGPFNLDGYWPIVNFSHQKHRSHSRLKINCVCKYCVNDGKVRLISPPTTDAKQLAGWPSSLCSDSSSSTHPAPPLSTSPSPSVTFSISSPNCARESGRTRSTTSFL